VAKFIKDLDLVNDALNDAGVASTLMPGLRRTWEAAAGEFSEAVFAALTEAYVSPGGRDV
jgi:hypothetical protein